MQDLIERIDAFLARHKMSDSRFSREAMNDSAFLLSLREGRRKTIMMATLQRLDAYMARKDAEVPAEKDTAA